MNDNNSTNYFDELKKNAQNKQWNINYGYVNNESMERKQHEKNILALGSTLLLIAGGCYFVYKKIYKPLKQFFNSPTTKEVFKSFEDIYNANQKKNGKESTVNFSNRSIFRPIERSDPDFVTKMFDKRNMLTVDESNDMEFNTTNIY